MKTEQKNTTYNAETYIESTKYDFTMNYYRFMNSQLFYTDGVRWLCNEINAYWLLADIYKLIEENLDAFEQQKENGYFLFLIEITNPRDNKALIAIKGVNDEVICHHYIEYTDLVINESDLTSMKIKPCIEIYLGLHTHDYILSLIREY